MLIVDKGDHIVDDLGHFIKRDVAGVLVQRGDVVLNVEVRGDLRLALLSVRVVVVDVAELDFVGQRSLGRQEEVVCVRPQLGDLGVFADVAETRGEKEEEENSRKHFFIRALASFSAEEKNSTGWGLDQKGKVFYIENAEILGKVNLTF